MEKNFELIVRALIIRDKKALLCKSKKRGYFFLPGGHIEFGETMRQALMRELGEELGAKIVESKFIGSIENLYTKDGEKIHEVSFIFHTDIDLEKVESKEEHIEFSWLSFEEFLDVEINPPVLKDAITSWRAEKEPFFIESEDTD
jgi:8-oxo-dGTP pyrophosphatase MutT (NUDIX family)